MLRADSLEGLAFSYRDETGLLGTPRMMQALEKKMASASTGRKKSKK